MRADGENGGEVKLKSLQKRYGVLHKDQRGGERFSGLMTPDDNDYLTIQHSSRYLHTAQRYGRGPQHGF